MISTELKTTIQGAYSRFLEAKSLKPRYGQRLMIAEIAKVLGDIDTDDEGRRSGDPAIVAVEAGTGTGKTVAYSLAAIPTAKAAGKRLVIATATVALQEQIVYKDLPDLMRNSGLNFSFALAKGRGRYMCLSKLDMLLQEGHAQTATAQLFEEEGFKIEVDEASQKLFTSMIEKLAGNKWDGDRDSWSTALEDADWARLTTDHSQCTNRHCPNFGQCAFYKAREGMGKVDVIVTNHDMVLADLALGAVPYCRTRVTPSMCSTKATTCRTRPSATSPITRACAPPPTGWRPPPRTSPSCSPSIRCPATWAS